MLFKKKNRQINEIKTISNQIRRIFVVTCYGHSQGHSPPVKAFRRRMALAMP